MFGIGTKKARLHVNAFTNLLGEDKNGWGLSHKGLLWHGGIARNYTKRFKENQATRIGILFDGVAGTLTYYKDDVCLGIAFRGLNEVSGGGGFLGCWERDLTSCFGFVDSGTAVSGGLLDGGQNRDGADGVAAGLCQPAGPLPGRNHQAHQDAREAGPVEPSVLYHQLPGGGPVRLYHAGDAPGAAADRLLSVLGHGRSSGVVRLSVGLQQPGVVGVERLFVILVVQFLVATPRAWWSSSFC